MARFPHSEPEIAALAMLVTQGLGQATEDFPAPPVPASDLQAQLDAYNAARAATVVAETAFREHHAVKDEALEDLVDGVKANLRYAEVAARDRPEKLSQLGWAGRRSGSALEAPGEVRDIGIRAEGDNWVVLDWKPPVDGGTAAAYTIQRRKRAGGSWRDVGTSVDTAQLLSDQQGRYRPAERDGHGGAVTQAVTVGPRPVRREACGVAAGWLAYRRRQALWAGIDRPGGWRWRLVRQHERAARFRDPSMRGGATQHVDSVNAVSVRFSAESSAETRQGGGA